jgi:aspartyl-tRNA(Asn)/glutamyl-tRNA(Gln) amidotransferase subunit A
MGDAFSLPIAEIAALLGEGKLKARALAEEAIANHERFGSRLMAYSQWAPEHARKCADAADAAFAVGSRAGSLQGIPTSIKDLFAVAGFPTHAGSPRRLPTKFEIDGPVVANLRAQLATVMGKTHMVEFAFGGTGQNAHYGSPRNPWDATAHRSPGGSSSGAGVSLCEGSALLAFGTDTAASVRLPAAMTGNAGLKLTKGRWSTEGIVPLSFTLDTPGIAAWRMLLSASPRSIPITATGSPSCAACRPASTASALASPIPGSGKAARTASVTSSGGRSIRWPTPARL